MLEHHPSETAPDDLVSIRARLRSRSPLIRDEAERSLARLPITQLIGLMAAEKRGRNKRRTALTIGISVYVSVAVLVIVLTHNLHGLNFFGWFGGFGGVIAAAFAFSPAHKSAARALAAYDVIDGVGPLVEALEILDPTVQSAVNQGLARLLPRLRASDAALINVEQRRVLRRILAARPNYRRMNPDTLNMMKSLLMGLQQVGDESFLEPVKNLADGHGFGALPEVREAAEDCLPFLARRLENLRLQHDLLRAASPERDDDREILLRAAASQGVTEPSELLRPTDRA